MTDATKHVNTGSVEDGAGKSLCLVSSQKSPSQRSPSRSAAVVTAVVMGGEGGGKGGGDSVSEGGSGDGEAASRVAGGEETIVRRPPPMPPHAMVPRVRDDGRAAWAGGSRAAHAPRQRHHA